MVEDIEQAIASPMWDEAHTSIDEDSVTSYEWWNGSRKLTVYTEENYYYYIKVFSEPEFKMEPGEFTDEQEILALWDWLQGRG